MRVNLIESRHGVIICIRTPEKFAWFIFDWRRRNFRSANSPKITIAYNYTTWISERCAWLPLQLALDKRQRSFDPFWFFHLFSCAQNMRNNPRVIRYTFPFTPNQMRQIEHHRLGEQHKWHPLIVCMVTYIVFVIERTDAGMRNDTLFQLCFVEMAHLKKSINELFLKISATNTHHSCTIYHCECRCEETECIDYMLGNGPICDASDMFANVLSANIEHTQIK